MGVSILVKPGSGLTSSEPYNTSSSVMGSSAPASLSLLARRACRTSACEVSL
jgi:hypothetical protein